MTKQIKNLSVLVSEDLYNTLVEMARVRERSIGAEVRLAIMAHINSYKRKGS